MTPLKQRTAKTSLNELLDKLIDTEGDHRNGLKDLQNDLGPVLDRIDKYLNP